MGFPVHRPRRLREQSGFREMFCETRVQMTDLIYPMFVIHGRKVKNPVPSMPGVYQFSVDQLIKEMRELLNLGISSVILLGSPKPRIRLGPAGVRQTA